MAAPTVAEVRVGFQRSGRQEPRILEAVPPDRPGQSGATLLAVEGLRRDRPHLDPRDLGVVPDAEAGGLAPTPHDLGAGRVGQEFPDPESLPVSPQQ